MNIKWKDKVITRPHFIAGSMYMSGFFITVILFILKIDKDPILHWAYLGLGISLLISGLILLFVCHQKEKG